jgi:tetratricopeptide (TPR) repeat protein
MLTLVLVGVPCGGTSGEPERKGSEADQSDAPSIDPRAFAACIQLLEAERYAEARGLAERLVEEHPEDSQAYLLLALSWHKERKYERAETHFKAALARDADNHPAKIFYGWCLYNLGRGGEARAMFEAFLKAQPNYADAHFAIGLIDFDEDDIDAAGKRFRTAIELSQRAGQKDDEAKAHARLADVLMRREKLEEAKEHLEQSVALNPDLYGAYFKLSRVLQRLGDAEGAKRARALHVEARNRVRPPEGHPE